MVTELLEEAEGLNIAIENSIVTELIPTYPSKILFQVNCMRNILLFRLHELAKNSCTHYKNGDLLSAITLTRSAIETAAFLYKLYEEVFNAVEGGDLNPIVQFLKRGLLGSKNQFTTEEAINVLKFIDAVNKEIPNFRNLYDVLSEYVHPNWLGVGNLFSAVDKENSKLILQKTDDENIYEAGLGALTSSQEIASHYNDMIDKLFPAFVDLCNSKVSEVSTAE